MTKKELEKKIADLEAKLAELTSAMLTLSLKQQQNFVFVPPPQTQPLAVPNQPTWPPYTPYIGDIPGSYPTVTSGVATSKIFDYESFRILN